MKNYIISEGELREFCTMIWYMGDSEIIKPEVKDFLKSKQPVELVAEGEVMSEISGENKYKSIEVNNPCGGHFGYIDTSIDDGKDIKIYIQKAKEKK